MLLALRNMNITVKKNSIPNDPLCSFVTSGILVGTPASTTRGMKEDDMSKIAQFIKLTSTDFESSAETIRAGITALCEKYLLY